MKTIRSVSNFISYLWEEFTISIAFLFVVPLVLGGIMFMVLKAICWI